MRRYIAVDIGGTRMRAACYTSEGLEPIKLARIPTQDPNKNELPLDRLKSLIQSIWPADGDITSISVAAPGLVNPYTGTIIMAPNIPGWINLPLRRRLEEYFKVPVILGNDANLAALGEWMFGAGQGHHHMIYITVSTGIGSGIIINDRLLLGDRGLAAEIGHVTLVPDGPMCNCGQRGHLEALASGTATARWVQDKLDQGAQSVLSGDPCVDTKKIALAAKDGDTLSIAAIERSGRFIGQAVANLLHIFNPTAVIVGGGVSRSGAFLLEPMRAALIEHVIDPVYMENLTLTRAAFSDEVGLIGALAHARSKYPITAHKHG